MQGGNGTARPDEGAGLLIFAPTDPALTLRPLLFLQAELLRLRLTCALFDVFAQDHDWLGTLLLESLLRLLRFDLPRHEEDLEDLLALLPARLRVGDLVDGLLGQIALESRADRQAARALSAGLQDFAAGGADERAVADSAAAFAEQQRRRLRWQEVALLPIAGQRLQDDDLARLGSSYAARRGYDGSRSPSGLFRGPCCRPSG